MFYVFDRKPLLAGRWVDDGPFIDDADFDVGLYIKKKDIDTPIEYTLKKIDKNSVDHGPYMPAYLRDAYPLFRTDLVAALQECGVSNIQVFDAIVHDPERGEDIETYKAVNIVGLISMLNMENSLATVHEGSALKNDELGDIFIDEQKAKGALMFRLAEATRAIIVHERIRDCLLDKGFGKDLEFFEPAEYAI